MEFRDFVYVGEPIPEIKMPEHADFILQLQKSMLLSLVKRKLITSAQMDCIMAELEKQYQKPTQ
ncbi:MAG: hypothetical protein FWD71_08865 [Oscillospiraceae bacterium]|nr:hypothetical protein [Oscillospiraceae bacterium]